MQWVKKVCQLFLPKPGIEDWRCDEPREWRWDERGKKVPCNLALVLSFKKYSIQASECQALDKQHFEAKAAKLLENGGITPKMEGNGTQSPLKMLPPLCVTWLVYDESSVAMCLETLPGLGLLSVLQTNKSLLGLAELGASLLGPGDDAVAWLMAMFGGLLFVSGLKAGSQTRIHLKQPGLTN